MQRKKRLSPAHKPVIKEDIIDVPHKVLMSRINTRLVTINRTTGWLRNKLVEKGLPPRISKLSLDDIVIVLDMIDKEKEKQECLLH